MDTQHNFSFLDQVVDYNDKVTSYQVYHNIKYKAMFCNIW